MKLMLRLQNKDFMVFFPAKTADSFIQGFRRRHPEMKYARKLELFHAYPSRVVFGNIYNRYNEEGV